MTSVAEHPAVVRLTDVRVRVIQETAARTAHLYRRRRFLWWLGLQTPDRVDDRLRAQLTPIRSACAKV